MTTITLPLEGLYQRGARATRSGADVRAAQADAEQVRQRIGLDATAAYYRTALAQVELATTRELVQWLDSIVTYDRSRAREGAISEAELIRSELERDRTVARAAMQAADLAQARAALGGFLSPAHAATLAADITIVDAPLTFPDQGAFGGDVATGTSSSALFATMLNRRHDVRAARERTASGAAGVSVERSMRLRQLGATFGAMQSGGMTSMIAGVSLPLPLFDANRGEIQHASALRDAAQFALQQQERTANAELRGAYDAARLLTDRALIFARRDSGSFLARAEESRRIAFGAYREGAVPLLQVIDVARAWADARSTYYQLLFAQHQSILTLIVAAGQDLFATFPTLPSNGTESR